MTEISSGAVTMVRRYVRDIGASLDSGRDHVLAITTTGQLWDWGFDDAGQLGDGSTANRLTPQQIPGISNAVMAGGGRNYTVLLRS